jgi:maleylpyruvate isomerase
LEISGCRQAHQVLLEALGSLTDEQARSPSLLPDWSVGHVLTHIARNADSVTRRLDGAARGEIVDQYPGGYARRAADIAGGAGRPAAELVADVQDTASRVEVAFLSLPPEAWDRLTRDVSGAERPARTTVFVRWCEVVVHHSDLGLGYTADQWPDELVAAWLPRQLERLAKRTDPKSLLAWTIGRGEAPALGPW